MAVLKPHADPSAAAAGPRVATPRERTPRAPLALLAALVACMLYAAFADGATGLPQAAWLQVALAVVATAGVATWLYGGGLRLRASAAGWAGLGLLVLFAVWAGASIAWSVAPDRSWAELNRALAYALTVLCGLLVGASLPRAAERTAKALALFSLPVALYALGGKTLPGVQLGGLIDLDHAGGFNRLKAPLEYWNALALVCVTGMLPMLRLAADPWRRTWWRIAALEGVFLLILVVGMTYSRGGVVAMLAGVAVFVALTTERIRTLALFASAAVASSLPLVVMLTRPDLVTDRLPVARREDDALMVLIAVVVVGGALALWGRAVIALERRRRLSPERGRRTGRPAAAVLAVVLGLAFVNAVASGQLASAVDSFTDREGAAGLTDPDRLLSANSGNRWTWWQEAAGAWSDRPVAGWGGGSFPVIHKRYRRDMLSVQQPHSVPLQWLAETGLVGLLLAAGALLALLAAAVARVLRMRWAVGGAPPERGYGAALAAVAVAWMAHALYDWDWDIPAVTLPMLLALSVLAARPGFASGPVGGRAPALAAAVVVAVLIVVSAVLPALAERRTQSALTAIGQGEVTDAQLRAAAHDAEVAASLNPLAIEPLFAASTIAERRGRDDAARAAIVRALERQPDSVEAWVRLARFEFQRLDRAGVRRASMRALELDPMNPAVVALARRAQQNSALPNESATATGSPLPTQVPVTEAQPVAPVPGGDPNAVRPPPEVGEPPVLEPPLPEPSPTPTPTVGGAPAP